MLILNPPTVQLGPHTLDDVALLAIDRVAHRKAEEWSDAGPHPVFADVPEQRTVVRIVRRLERDDPAPPLPGEQHTLAFHTSPNLSDADRRRISIAAAVVTAVTHQVGGGPSGRGAQQTITLTALSPDGASDPISITTIADGAD